MLGLRPSQDLRISFREFGQDVVDFQLGSVLRFLNRLDGQLLLATSLTAGTLSQLRIEVFGQSQCDTGSRTDAELGAGPVTRRPKDWQ
ncbi:hypothetical protein ACZ90_61390 [Streptomyces albus subsp. albus]|nr:hypothetical protein ACZ90_61390 [Streptomyces albus subsp. albus]